MPRPCGLFVRDLRSNVGTVGARMSVGWTSGRIKLKIPPTVPPFSRPGEVYAARLPESRGPRIGSGPASTDAGTDGHGRLTSKVSCRRTFSGSPSPSPPYLSLSRLSTLSKVHEGFTLLHPRHGRPCLFPLDGLRDLVGLRSEQSPFGTHSHHARRGRSASMSITITGICDPPEFLRNTGDAALAAISATSSTCSSGTGRLWSQSHCTA